MYNILLEELSAENKKKFRELARKYHPDVGGDEEIAKRINNAKESDERVEELYRELILNKAPKETPRKTYRPEPSAPPKTDTQRWKDKFSSKEERDEWHEEIKRKRQQRSEKVRRQQRGRR